MNHRPGVDVSNNRPGIHGFTLAPHHTFAYATKSTNFDGFRSSIASSTDPVPIFSINYSGRLMKDPAMATVLRRKKLEADKAILKRRIQKESLPKNQISKNMVKYIEMSETDPDPLIGTEYDWRYLGGNLEVHDDGLDTFLVQPSMCREYDIRLFNRDQPFASCDLPFNTKDFDKNYAYELLTCKDFIGVRRKNKFSFAKKDDIGLKHNLKTSIELKCPTDIAGCHMRGRDLIYIDVNQELTRVDLHDDFFVNGVIRLPATGPKYRFPVSVKSFDRETITYTNLKQLNMVDFRTSNVDTIFGEENFVMKCEELAYHTRSVRKNILYVASSHVLYGIDRRMPKKVMMHWNHQMIMHPTMIKTTELHLEEIICLSSNKPGDLKIFNCSDPIAARGINCLPYKPRSIGDSYKKLRGKGDLLLSETIKHRVDLSVTGLALIAVKGRTKAKIELYTQNSIGDIFKTDLYPNNKYRKDDKEPEQVNVSKNFHEWDNATKVDNNALNFASTKELLSHGDLRFTDIVNLKGLSSVLRCERLQTNGEETDYGEMKTKKIPQWKVDLEEAKEHKDVLAKFILDEWELDIEETQPQAFAEALLATQNLNKVGADKVSWWLDTTSVVAEDMDLDELLAEPLTQLTEPPSQMPDTQQSDVRKLPKKPSQRVKGF